MMKVGGCRLESIFVLYYYIIILYLPETPSWKKNLLRNTFSFGIPFLEKMNGASLLPSEHWTCFRLFGIF